MALAHIAIDQHPQQVPRSIGQLKIYQTKVNGVPIYAEVEPVRDGQKGLRFDARVVDADGQLFLEVQDYRTVALPYSVDQTLLDPLKGLSGPDGCLKA